MSHSRLYGFYEAPGARDTTWMEKLNELDASGETPGLRQAGSVMVKGSVSGPLQNLQTTQLRIT